jgi:hypothetical protein
MSLRRPSGAPQGPSPVRAAAHDLKASLRTISSFLGLLQERFGDDLDEDGKRYIEHTLHAAARLSEIFDGLHAFDRLEGPPADGVSCEASEAFALAVRRPGDLPRDLGAVIECGDRPPRRSRSRATTSCRHATARSRTPGEASPRPKSGARSTEGHRTHAPWAPAPSGPAVDLRAVLHDQGEGKGHRARARDLLRHRSSDGGRHLGRDRARTRQRFRGMASANGRAAAVSSVARRGVSARAQW